ncbi:putative Ribosome biogenesis protein NEP1-like [Tripterygium wilfordii]|uniref:Putative Ribosome biogenesis protein NEP1-like n=1 Tax=Tripterygium wilfordii TaxID=458696 RepID=A0A7J7BXJ7_TRIWF|nr:putative Ribosome biogenesis protein NEP1-like [Tripterygium wilfordii]
MLVVALSNGGHTAKQQLVHSPSVYVSKKRRESFPEVADHDRSLAKADKFVNKTFLRKVGHIQERNPVFPNTFGTSRPDPFARNQCMNSIGGIHNVARTNATTEI